MKFRDNDSWGLWISTLAIVPICVCLIRRCCLRIAEGSADRLAMFFAILGLSLISQLFLGASVWRLLDVQSRYEIDESGFRSAKYAHKMWSRVTWEELPYRGMYRRWGLKRYAYFANYDFDGKRVQGPLNDAAAKRVLFILPLSKRGRQAIQRYCLDKRQNLGM